MEYNTKELIKEMPYIALKDVKTGEVIDDYIHGYYSLPPGFFKLFVEMCRELKEPIKRVETETLEEFEFIGVKEKDGAMRVYYYPYDEELHDIIKKYEAKSTFTCMKCGKLAEYELGDSVFAATFCGDCLRDEDRPHAEPLNIDKAIKNFWEEEIRDEL